jgi:hypothetical protein
MCWRYPFATRKLGPAVAKTAADLFEGSTYETIRQIKPELAFQPYIVDDNLHECQRALANEKVKIRG